MTCIWGAGVKPERASSVLMTSASPPSILPLKQTLSSQSESKREGREKGEREPALLNHTEWMRADVYPLSSRTHCRQEELRERGSVATLCWESILTIPSFTQTLTHSQNKVSPCDIPGWMERVILSQAVWGNNTVLLLLIVLSQFVLLEVLPLCWILMGLSEPSSWSVCVRVDQHTCASVCVWQHALLHKPKQRLNLCLPAGETRCAGECDGHLEHRASETGWRNQCLLFTHSPLVVSCWVCRILCSLRLASSLCSSLGVGTVSTTHWCVLLRWNVQVFAYIVRDSAWWFLKSAGYDRPAYTPSPLHRRRFVWLDVGQCCFSYALRSVSRAHTWPKGQIDKHFTVSMTCFDLFLL